MQKVCLKASYQSVHKYPPARGIQNNSENEPANDDSKTVLTSFTSSRDTPQSPRSCLPKTAIAPITYEGTSSTIESNILFDEGSHAEIIYFKRSS